MANHTYIQISRLILKRTRVGKVYLELPLLHTTLQLSVVSSLFLAYRFWTVCVVVTVYAINIDYNDYLCSWCPGHHKSRIHSRDLLLTWKLNSQLQLLWTLCLKPYVWNPMSVLILDIDLVLVSQVPTVAVKVINPTIWSEAKLVILHNFDVQQFHAQEM